MGEPISAAEIEKEEDSPELRRESACSRCGGLVVPDFCMDVLGSTGEFDLALSRCVQCGEVVDPIILQNRRRQQESMTVPHMTLRFSQVRITG